MPVTIRNAAEGDIELLATVICQVISNLSYYNEIARKSELDKYSSVELSKKIKEDPYSVFIAVNGNEILGFCLNRMDDMLVWLEWFGVIEPLRRKGIGMQIISYLECAALKRGSHKIWCDCRTGNFKSINLLSKAGFLPICTLKNHWYMQDFILWQKEISPHENR